MITINAFFYCARFVEAMASMGSLYLNMGRESDSFNPP